MKLVAFYVFVVLCIACSMALAAYREGNNIVLDEDEAKVCDELGCIVISKPTLLRIINSCGTPT